MNHKAIKDKLNDYLDQELPIRQSEEIAGHIKACSECQDLVHSWTKIRQAFFKAPEITPNETLVYQVMEKIEAKQAFDTFAFLRWAFPTFAVMSLIVFSISAWLPNESIAFEASILKGGSPFAIQEVAMNSERDWTGLEAL